jgi:hypothetical protein
MYKKTSKERERGKNTQRKQKEQEIDFLDPLFPSFPGKPVGAANRRVGMMLGKKWKKHTKKKTRIDEPLNPPFPLIL